MLRRASRVLSVGVDGWLSKEGGGLLSAMVSHSFCCELFKCPQPWIGACLGWSSADRGRRGYIFDARLGGSIIPLTFWPRRWAIWS
jgi:hypothetical protein